jgi:adenine-specific DNA-methyltransferase
MSHTGRSSQIAHRSQPKISTEISTQTGINQRPTARSQNYHTWSKDELIQEIQKLEKRKKYGLVWEPKLEEVAELCKEKLPVLVEDKSKEIGSSQTGPTNLLIEGDNYHALSVLNYTHKGKIDVIYIDPPFNTGAKDWKYNNDYVDIND